MPPRLPISRNIIYQLTSRTCPNSAYTRAYSDDPVHQASLDSLCSELLTSSPLRKVSRRHSQENPPSSFTSSSLPEVRLSRNPWADSYTVSEEQLDDPFEEDMAEEVPPPRSPLKTRRRRLASRRYGSSEPLTTLAFSPQESVSVFPGFISVSSHGRSGIISNARLYDSCTCRRCVDGSTKQRTTTTGEAVREARSVRVTKGKSINAPEGSKAGLIVSSGTEGRHKSFFPLWALRQMIEPESDLLYRSPTFTRQTWDGESLPLTNLHFKYSNLEKSLLKILEQLQVYGIVVIKDVPTDTTGDKDCMLRKVVGMIGEIRNTFYGEVWDVKNMKQSKNIAYTNQNLGLHMDLLYFSSPPRFQALHCLRNQVRGGMSSFVDSFRTVQDLHKDHFEMLKSVTIPYMYINDNHHLRHRHPIISPDFGDGSRRLHAAVNWSPPFRARMDLVDFPQKDPIVAAREEEKVFQSIADFEERLNDPRYRHSFTMEAGDLVLFDNRRILHARTAFRDREDKVEAENQDRLETGQGTDDADKGGGGGLGDKGEPARWLKGCYLDGEAVWDKLAILKREAIKQRRADAKKERMVE